MRGLLLYASFILNKIVEWIDEYNCIETFSLDDVQPSWPVKSFRNLLLIQTSILISFVQAAIPVSPVYTENEDIKKVKNI